jgi:glutamine synthetase adenylyltransferase
MGISASDLFLSADLREEEAHRFLRTFGFREPAAADRRLQALADQPAVRDALAEVAVQLLEALKNCGDPDEALSAFVRYVETRSSRAGFLRYLKEDPGALGLLIDVSRASTILRDYLVAFPDALHWLRREIDRSPPDSTEHATEIDRLLASGDNRDARRHALKQFTERELVRITTRDLVRRDTTDSTIEQVSDLIDALLDRLVR